MDNNLVKVFWSCGFDSTYLVCDLVLKGYTVQPFYLKNCKTKDWKRIERRNQDKEISLFPILSEKINEIGSGKILDVVMIEAEEYKSEECSEILSQHHEIFSKEHQYSYLSNYCFQTNQKIAIGLENVPKPKGSVGPWLKDFVGLHGEYSKTLKEVGEIMGYSAMGIQKIEKNALSKLRRNKGFSILNV